MRELNNPEQIFSSYYLLVANLNLRASQSHGHFAFIKMVLSAAISIFVLLGWLPLYFLLHEFQQPMKNYKTILAKKKKKR